MLKKQIQNIVLVNNRQQKIKNLSKIVKTYSNLKMSEVASNISILEQEFPAYNYPLKFEVLKKCKASKARSSNLTLPHAALQTPQFMPVGTQGALKGILPEQIKELNCNLILGNTYHLGHRPVSCF
jgi:hypothetical protein